MFDQTGGHDQIRDIFILYIADARDPLWKADRDHTCGIACLERSLELLHILDHIVQRHLVHELRRRAAQSGCIEPACLLERLQSLHIKRSVYIQGSIAPVIGVFHCTHPRILKCQVKRVVLRQIGLERHNVRAHVACQIAVLHDQRRLTAHLRRDRVVHIDAAAPSHGDQFTVLKADDAVASGADTGSVIIFGDDAAVLKADCPAVQKVRIDMQCVPSVIFLPVPAVPDQFRIDLCDLLLRENHLPCTAAPAVQRQVRYPARRHGERRRAV